MLKFLLLAAAASSKCLALPWKHEFTSSQLAAENAKGLFHEWRLAQSKVYETVAEEMRRFGVFSKNMERIAEGNDEFHAGKRGFLLRMNHFGDLNDDERREAVRCELEEDTDDFVIADESAQLKTGDENKDLSSSSHFDWKDKGYVGSVKSQGHCGSCWAFASVAGMECNYAIKNNKSPRDMSEQQLVDCVTSAHGCSGGHAKYGWQYAIDAGGMCSESSYPYKGKDGSCSDNCYKHSAPKGYEFITSHSSSALKNAVDGGCMTVSVEADQFEFDYYSSGILDGTCGYDTGHTVTVTGYGVRSGEEYWIVKNSWGDDWGIDGYLWLCRHCDKNGSYGQCGILKKPRRVLY